eukprot:4286666-Prymnesium_polylepis.1
MPMPKPPAKATPEPAKAPPKPAKTTPQPAKATKPRDEHALVMDWFGDGQGGGVHDADRGRQLLANLLGMPADHFEDEHWLQKPWLRRLSPKDRELAAQDQRSPTNMLTLAEVRKLLGRQKPRPARFLHDVDVTRYVDGRRMVCYHQHSNLRSMPRIAHSQRSNLAARRSRRAMARWMRSGCGTPTRRRVTLSGWSTRSNGTRPHTSCARCCRSTLASRSAAPRT